MLIYWSSFVSFKRSSRPPCHALCIVVQQFSYSLCMEKEKRNTPSSNSFYTMFSQFSMCSFVLSTSAAIVYTCLVNVHLPLQSFFFSCLNYVLRYYYTYQGPNQTWITGSQIIEIKIYLFCGKIKIYLTNILTKNMIQKIHNYIFPKW